METEKQSGKMDLEVTIKMTGKHGEIIQRTISLNDAIPDTSSFDVCTREGFLRDLDLYEHGLLQASRMAKKAVSDAYTEEVSKKKLKNSAR